jgi:hypothetical protein
VAEIFTDRDAGVQDLDGDEPARLIMIMSCEDGAESAPAQLSQQVEAADMLWVTAFTRLQLRPPSPFPRSGS